MYRFLLVCVCLFLAWGCGSQRKAQSSRNNGRPAVWDNRPAPQPVPPVLMPEERMPSSSKSPAPVVRVVRTEDIELPSAIPSDEAPPEDTEFEPDETRHVSLVKAAPLPGKMLVVALPGLRGQFVYPCDGKVISPYGKRGSRMHTGVDIKPHPGDTIRAILPGVVRMSKSYADYGNIVVIRHPCGLETLYGHNLRNLVNVNDKVVEGQAIALAGRTGRATTEHLHFEVRAGGKHLDPSLVVDHAARSLNNDTLFIYNKGDRLLVLNAAQARDVAADRKPAASPSSDARPETAPVAVEMAGYQAPVRPETAAAPETTVHTVVRGDALSTIAVRYHTTVDQLCRRNGIARNGTLRLGQKIVVAGGTVDAPSGSAQAPEQRPAPPASSCDPQPVAERAAYHTVGKGETLSQIARRFGLTLDELCRLNDIRDPDRVAAGQRLRLLGQAAPPPAR